MTRAERIIEELHGIVQEIVELGAPVLVWGSVVYIAAQIVRVIWRG